MKDTIQKILPKQNTPIQYWHKNFGYNIAGTPKWKQGICIYFEDEYLFIENSKDKKDFRGLKRSIVSEVSRWKYLKKIN